MNQYHTKIQVPEFKFSYKLTIENFSRFFKNKEYNCSQVYFSHEYWHFKLLKTNTSVSVRLCREASTVDVFMRSQVLFSDSTNRIILNHSKELKLGECRTQNTKYEVALLDGEGMKEVEGIPDDLLIVTIDLVISKMVAKDVQRMPTIDDYHLDAQESLCHDVLETYDNSIHTDIVLNVQGEKINVHKYILCSRSPVFAKMFQQQMAEAAKNVVDIEDVKVEAMKELIDFMYSRVNVCYNFEEAMDVYYAADKYEVLKLREMCGNIILQAINERNALMLLKMADKHKDKSLKSAVMDFIKFNFVNCVKENWWADFAKEKSELFEELMHIC